MTGKQNIGCWYAVRSLYGADRGTRGVNSRALLEERFQLIHSAPRAAVAVAQKEAKRYEHSYRNQRGETVRWKLLQVLSIVEIVGKIKHGAEIYSCYHLNAKPASTIKRLGFRPDETSFRLFR